MGSNHALLTTIALFCGALAMSGEAWAQCRLCDTPDTQRSEEDSAAPLRLEVQAELDFDRIVLLDSSGGSATIAPDGNHRTSGALGALSGRAMIGSVTVRGAPGKLVRIDLPRAIVLHGRVGGSIELVNLAHDLPDIPRLDSQGTLQFRFGGELKVTGEIDGDYRGDVPITVEYL